MQVINTFNKFDLPGYWGSGKSASADGTKWSMYEQNLLSEYHIRYGVDRPEFHRHSSAALRVAPFELYR